MEMNRTSKDIIYNTVAIFPFNYDFQIRFLNVRTYQLQGTSLSNIIYRIRRRYCLARG